MTFSLEHDSLWAQGQKSVGSKLWDGPVWPSSGQEGIPLAWPTSQSQHRKCQQTSTSGHLICSGLAGSTRLPELSSWQCWLAGTMTLVLGGCSAPVLSPTARERSQANMQKTSGAARGAGRSLDGGHCTVVGIQFHAPSRRAVRGHPLLNAPGRRLVGRQLLTPSRRRHCGD